MLILLSSQYFYCWNNEDLIYEFILGSIYTFVICRVQNIQIFIYLCQPHSIFIYENNEDFIYKVILGSIHIFLIYCV